MGAHGGLGWVVGLVLLLALLESVSAFSFATTPTGYKVGDTIRPVADSYRTQRGLVPIDIHRVPLCQPSEDVVKNFHQHENLGEILMGNRIYPSPFQFVVGRNQACLQLCNAILNKKDLNRVRAMVRNKYRGYMYLDGLPVISLSSGTTMIGYRLGETYFGPASPLASLQYYLNNHFKFTITYHYSDNNETVYITQFSMAASSRGSPNCNDKDLNTDGFNLPAPKKNQDSINVEVTYEVEWVENPSESAWTTRFDIYNNAGGRQKSMNRGHWITAINSVVLVALFGLVVAFVLARTVRRDLLQYADEEMLEEMREESGWKLVRGDVFRTPPFPLLLSSLISAGCQLIFMLMSTMLAAGLGIFHPSQRGNLLTGLIFFFLLASGAAGYVAGRMLKFFKLQTWANGLFTVLLFPIVLTCGYMLLNFIHMIQRSSSAIPFPTLIFLLLAWVFCSFPLAVCGLATGFRQEVLSVPARVSAIPRLIPLEARGKSAIFMMVGGFIPFVACFVEVIYVFGSFWRGENFYKMGFLALVGLLVGVLCAEVAIVVTYITLVNEDYRWWWRSFASVGSAGLYLFLYSIYYLVSYLEVRLVSSMILFLGYSFGLSMVFGVMCGTVGFLAAGAFVHFIYGAVKGD